MTRWKQQLGVISVMLALTMHAVNVRDFGAAGDGNTDDTAAVQRALDAALRTADKGRFGLAPLVPREPRRNLIGDSGTPEVFFPAGVYRITSPLVGGRIAMLRGAAGAVIEQTDPAADLLYFDAGRRLRIENLTFRGGNCQLRLWTRNGDMSILAVDRCRFEGAKVAFRTDSLALRGSSPQKKVPPYTVRRAPDGRAQLAPRSPENLKWMYNSTIVSFTGCEFRDCRRAVWSQVDYLVLENCRVTPAREAAASIFYHRGLVRVNELTGRADPAPGRSSVWFELDRDSETTPPITAEGGYWSTGSYAFRKLDLDNTGERGMCVVRSNCIPRRSPRSILVTDSIVRAAGSPENGIIHIAAGTHPNLMVVRNVRERSGRPVRAVSYEREPESAGLARLRHYRDTPVTENYSIVLDGNSASIDNRLPEALLPFRDRTVAVEIPPETPRRSRSEAEESCLPATTLKPGLKQDQSAELQKLVDEAAKRGMHTLLIPGERYRVDRTIELPPTLRIAGRGVALLHSDNPEQIFFRGKAVRDITFENLKFSGGRSAAQLETPGNEPVRAEFDFCAFFGQTGTAVEFRAGSGKTGEPNQARLTLRNCLFRCRRGVDTNAAESELRTSWFHNTPELNDSGFLLNRGGRMVMIANLGIPTAFAPQKWKTLPQDVFGRNLRWVDNYGTLYLQDNRFGGESAGGIPAVFHRVSGGEVVIEGGYCSHYNPTTMQSVIHFEALPERLVIRELVTHPDRAPGKRRLQSGLSGGDVENSGVFARY